MHAASSSSPDVASPDDAWAHVFKSLKLLPDFEDIEIEVIEDNISIVCKNPAQLEALKKHLEENLAIPERLMQNARTQLNIANEQDEAAVAEATSIYRVQYAEQLPSAPKHGDGLAIFKHVFGEEFTVNVGMKVVVQWDSLFEEREGMTILLSKNPVEDIVEKICAKWADEVSKKASQIPLFNLRRLYMGQPLLAADDESLVFHTADEALLKRCFGFVQKGEDKYFYCDYDLLYKILFAPQIVEYKETEEEYASLTLNKKHLIAYLRQIFSEGVFMALLEGKTDEAKPVLLPSPASQAAPTVVVLMLDVSGSMTRTDGLYEANVLALVRELAKRCTGAHDQLVIVPFSDKTGVQLRRYAFQDIERIAQDPEWLKCNGGTRLYGSLQEVLTSVAIQGTDLRHHNLNLILVTDGCDNVQTTENKEKLDKSIQDKTIVVPQFFTVGCGKEYDAKLCTELTRLTGGHHEELKNISELAALKHIEQVVRPRTLMEFRKAVQGVEAQFVSVYDAPVELDETIRAGDRFVLNGRVMSFAEKKVVVEQMDVEEMSPETAKKSDPKNVPQRFGGVLDFWSRVKREVVNYGKPVLMRQENSGSKPPAATMGNKQ